MSTTHPSHAASFTLHPTWTHGQAAAETSIPRYETKPTSTYADGSVDTGGGYCRLRSWERRPETPGDGKEDVYAAVHRLCAVAWCYPPEAPVGEILDDLHGKDVHHRSGVEWHNAEDNLEVLDHGRHSEVTQSQMRAWGEDAKEGTDDPTPDDEECTRCGAEPDDLWTSADVDGVYCIECSMEHGGGATFEVV